MGKHKCRVEDGKFVEPCKTLADATEFGNPIGKRKGVWCWEYHSREKSGPTRRFYGTKSGDFVAKGLAFNYCPFCGSAAPDHGAEIERLRNQLEEERARGIHSCGPKCQQSGCVNRRLREQVRALSDFIQEWLGRQGSDNNYMTEKARAALAAVKGEQA